MNPPLMGWLDSVSNASDILRHTCKSFLVGRSNLCLGKDELCGLFF